MLVSDEAPEATCLSSFVWLLPAPRSASFPAACVSLARRRRSSSSSGVTRGPRIDRAQGPAVTESSEECSARAWPVAREVPAGWCTIPTRTLARGMGVGSFATAHHPRRFIRPAVWSCSRRRGRLVCVPLRHVLPIGVSGVGHPTPSPSLPAPRPEGDRCSGPGIWICDNPPPRRRPRLA